MLVLSRRTHQRIAFPTFEALVQVVGIKGNTVRLGIEAPADVPVFREELLHPARQQQFLEQARQRRSADALLRELDHFVTNRLNSSDLGPALLRQLQLGMMSEAERALGKIENELGAFQHGLQSTVGQGAPGRPFASRKRALLVEDDRNERELLAGFLRLAGLEVETAGDGADALDYLRAHERPDVVLLDMMMPRCDGPAVVRTVRCDPAFAGLKIFGVTGSNYEMFGLADGPAGIDRWFRKPLNPETLLQELTANLPVET